MVSSVAEAHVHRRPGGAIAEAECLCPDPSAWPIPATGEDDGMPAPMRIFERNALEDRVVPLPEAEPLPPGTRRGRWQHRLREGRAAIARWLRAAARRGRGSGVRVTQGCGVLLWWLARLVVAAGRTAGAVVAALVTALGGAAQVAGVGIGTWAAWEIEPTAGRVVLAVGLLFLGGALGRVVREVRNGSTR